MPPQSGDGRVTPKKELKPEETEKEYQPQQIKELLVDGYYYDVTKFIPRHPGGRVIEFYTKTGEDATHAVKQFHFRSPKAVSHIMKSLTRRPALVHEGFDEETQRKRKALTEDFNKLFAEVEAEGMFVPSYTHNALRFIEILVMGSIGYYIFCFDSIYIKAFAFFLISLAHGRCPWLAHEAGHRSVTGIPKLDQFFQSILFGIGVGLSSRTWNTRHKRHHSMPNKLDYDIDLELMPFLVSDVKIVKKDDILWMAKYQTFLVPFTALGFILSHQLYVHPMYVIKKRCYLDGISMIMHYVIGCQIGFIPFFIMNFISTFYAQHILALNHTTLPVTSITHHWVEFTLLYTLNITPSKFNDWWMGYVNYQIEHHLFPSMPHFRHILVVDRVKALAKKHNLPYHIDSYWGAFSNTIKSHYLVQKELREMF